jgi:pyrroline-5-carboxylate reductase
MSQRIAIIGGGNLGTAIAEGLISSGFCSAENITLTKRNTATLEAFASKGFVIHSDNRKAVAESDVIILAVKPYNYAAILEDVKAELQPGKHMLISVITGVWLHHLQEAAGTGLPLFRAMPNTAIAIRESITCLCSSGATAEQIGYVKSLFDQLGKTVTIDEQLMDAATVLGACGTAFAMRYIRANIQGGIEIGFDAATASLIAAQTVKGAAELLLQTGSHPEKEIDKVTTPKGCTIAGLNEMEHQGFSSSMIKGISASYQKIVQ